MKPEELKRHLMNPDFQSSESKTNRKHIFLHEDDQEDSDSRLFA